MMTQQITLPEETKIATINDQINEIEQSNYVLENEIEGLEDVIRSKKRKIRANDKKAERMRAKRQVFAETAAKLRLIDMP